MIRSRREFLAFSAAAALGSLAEHGSGAESRRLEGISPIVQTPFTDSGALDHATLAREIEFLHRIGAQGVTWPQMASEYATMTREERIAGAETIIRANRNAPAATRPYVVIGVQDSTVEGAVAYAHHADRIGADAIIAIPLNGGKDESKQIEYYSAIGAASSRPLFVQTVGDMTVDLVIRMAKRIPTLRYAKDEAGVTLPRLDEYRSRAPMLTVFTGKHGPTLLADLARGAVGNMPAAGFADLYVATWRAWKAGRIDEAEEMFSKTLLLIEDARTYGVAGQKYILQLRGVFTNAKCRREAGGAPLDAEAKKAIEQTVNYTKRWFKA